MTRAKERAKAFARDVKDMMASKDNLIYSLNVGGSDDFDEDDPFELKALRCFSSGTVSIDPWIEIIPHNMSHNGQVLDPDEAAYLGREYGVDIENYKHEPGLCVHATFEY